MTKHLRKLQMPGLFHFIMSVLMVLIFVGDARPSSIKTIGIIYGADIEHYRAIHASFMKNLRKLGFSGKDIKIVEQRPHPNVVSWGNAARKVVAYDADLILAYGSGAAEEALAETSKIPVLFGGIYGEPSKITNRKNAYGCTFRVPLASFFRYLREAKEIKDVAVVYSPFEIDSRMQYSLIKQIGDSLSIGIIGISSKSSNDLTNKLKTESFDALFVTGSALANYEIVAISDICRQKKVPLMTMYEGTERYAFLTITTDTEQEGADLARIAKDLLRGNTYQVNRNITLTKTKIYFNLKLTNELGLRIPVRLVTSADKVIR